MIAFGKKHQILFAALCAYWIAVVVLIILSVNRNQGNLIYPLDDTYIHMAIAKNAVLNHVWGVTKYAFTSSTSSPLWTALLAVTYFAFGVNEISPLALNLLFGTLTITAAYVILTRYINNPLAVLAFLLIAIFAAPLPTLTVTGMEHVLHILLSLCFLYVSINTLSQNTKHVYGNSLYLILLSPLVSMVRYEGVFLILTVCILLLLQKRIFLSVSVGITALLPITLYGMVSVAHGWFFLPNSVLLKGQMPGFSPAGLINMLKLAFIKMLDARPVLLLLVLSLFSLTALYVKKENSLDDLKYANLIFIGTLLLHMMFASVGWFYRYEAYLIFLGVIVISISAANLLPWKFTAGTPVKRADSYPIGIFLMLATVFQCGERAFISLRDTPQATTNIYEQQYQMGIFIRHFYQGQTVVLNDMGAVAYLADIHLLDLSGLGSLEPAKLKMQGNYSTQQKFNLSQQQGAIIAVAYDQPGGTPRQWTKVGQWQIPNNLVCAGDTVSFFAISSSANVDLIRNLREFTKELPAEVRQDGTYMQ